MSQENVERFKRGIDAYNRRDADALLEFMDTKVEWHPAIWWALGIKRRCFAGMRASASCSEKQTRLSVKSTLRSRRFEILVIESLRLAAFNTHGKT